MIEFRLEKKKAGIYAYRNKENGEIVYIGKDKNINKLVRHKKHLKVRPHTRKYRIQKIDIILQKQPNLYVYEELVLCSEFDLDEIERIFINYYKPIFNLV